MTRDSHWASDLDYWLAMGHPPEPEDREELLEDNWAAVDTASPRGYNEQFPLAPLTAEDSPF